MRKAWKQIAAAALFVLIAAILIVPVLPQPRQSRCFQSVHAAEPLSPLMGLSPDSLLNTGDEKALDALPGVGTVIAKRIVIARTFMGGFTLPEDLLAVEGIGVKKLAGILDALLKTEALVAVEIK